jgi:hypothetical protein
MSTVDDRYRVMEMVMRVARTPSVHCLMIDGEPTSKCGARQFREVSPRLATTAAEERLTTWFRGKDPLLGNVALAAIFYRSNRQRIDVDNLLKVVLDAATKAGLWQDDCQVTALMGLVEYDPDRPRTIIAFCDHETTLKRGDNVKIACKGCGSLFVPYTPTRQHCSAACRIKLAEPINCGVCGKPFRRVASHIKLCSNACRIEHLRRLNTKNGPLPNCDRCGKQLVKHAFRRCRACWLKEPSTRQRPLEVG